MIQKKEFENAMKWGYPAVPFFTSVYFLLADEPKEEYFSKWNYLAFFQNNQLIGYNSRSICVVGEKIIQDLLSGNRNYLDSLQRTAREIERVTDVCLHTKAHNKIEDLDYWWRPGQKAFSDGANLIFGFDNALSEYFENLKKDQPDVYSAIQTHIVEKQESFMTQAQKDLLKIVDDNSGDFSKACTLFKEKYYWLQNSYIGTFNITEAWCEKTYNENKNRVPASVHQQIQPVDPQYALLIETAVFAITFRDERKKMFLILVDLMEDWLKIVCDKNNWNVDELKWLTLGEIELCLRGDTALLSKAREYALAKKRVGIMNPIGITDIDEETFGEIERMNSGNLNVTEFKGIVASKGKVRGTVKVVLDVHNDSAKLHKGDILVTSMTRPEYLSLMSIASAFITDEGGLTCHAGIVAREMNKPCIVGTKTATKILKDGDIVEVDANRGVVTILK